MLKLEQVIQGLEIVKRRLSRLPGFSEEIEVVSEAIDILEAQEERDDAVSACLDKAIDAMKELLEKTNPPKED